MATKSVLSSVFKALKTVTQKAVRSERPTSKVAKVALESSVKETLARSSLARPPLPKVEPIKFKDQPRPKAPRPLVAHSPLKVAKLSKPEPKLKPLSPSPSVPRHRFQINPVLKSSYLEKTEPTKKHKPKGHSSDKKAPTLYRNLSNRHIARPLPKQCTALVVLTDVIPNLQTLRQGPLPGNLLQRLIKQDPRHPSTALVIYRPKNTDFANLQALKQDPLPGNLLQRLIKQDPRHPLTTLVIYRPKTGDFAKLLAVKKDPLASHLMQLLLQVKPKHPSKALILFKKTLAPSTAAAIVLYNARPSHIEDTTPPSPAQVEQRAHRSLGIIDFPPDVDQHLQILNPAHVLASFIGDDNFDHHPDVIRAPFVNYVQQDQALQEDNQDNFDPNQVPLIPLAPDKTARIRRDDHNNHQDGYDPHQVPLIPLRDREALVQENDHYPLYDSIQDQVPIMHPAQDHAASVRANNPVHHPDAVYPNRFVPPAPLFDEEPEVFDAGSEWRDISSVSSRHSKVKNGLQDEFAAPPLPPPHHHQPHHHEVAKKVRDKALAHGLTKNSLPKTKLSSKDQKRLKEFERYRIRYFIEENGHRVYKQITDPTERLKVIKQIAKMLKRINPPVKITDLKSLRISRTFHHEKPASKTPQISLTKKGRSEESISYKGKYIPDCVAIKKLQKNLRKRDTFSPQTSVSSHRTRKRSAKA